MQISDGDRMLGAGRFSQVIVAETGHMAVMHTLNPRIFITLKTKLSQLASRDPKKRPKDALQAQLVQDLINGYMPQFQ